MAARIPPAEPPDWQSSAARGIFTVERPEVERSEVERSGRPDSGWTPLA